MSKPPKDLRYRDKAWLWQRYVADGQTINGIAKETGTNQCTISEWMVKLSVPLRPQGNWSTRKLYHDASWLRQEHIDKGRFATDIAAQFGVNRQTILSNLHRFEIPVQQERVGWRGPHWPKNEIQETIVYDYTTPSSGGTWTGSILLGRQYHLDPKTITAILKAHNVRIRTRSEAMTYGKTCKPDRKIAYQDKAPYIALYKDRDWLFHAYVEENQNASEIAHTCGSCSSSILNALKEFGIPRKTLSEAHIGRNKGSINGSWRGGTTPERQRFCRTPEWKQFIQTIYSRDNFHCIRCDIPKVTGIRFHCHHLHSWSDYPDLRLDPANCITLCQICHSWVHSKANTEHAFLL